MKVVKKHYGKNSKLKILKEGEIPNSSVIRFKIFKDKQEFPCCDWKGTCTNKAYAEVFPIKEKNKGWSYLCRKHYYQEQKRLNWKLPACLKVDW